MMAPTRTGTTDWSHLVENGRRTGDAVGERVAGVGSGYVTGVGSDR